MARETRGNEYPRVFLWSERGAEERGALLSSESSQWEAADRRAEGDELFVRHVHGMRSQRRRRHALTAAALAATGALVTVIFFMSSSSYGGDQIGASKGQVELALQIPGIRPATQAHIDSGEWSEEVSQLLVLGLQPLLYPARTTGLPRVR
eukprot:730894-Rhodomonas_salina.2